MNETSVACQSSMDSGSLSPSSRVWTFFIRRLSEPSRGMLRSASALLVLGISRVGCSSCRGSNSSVQTISLSRSLYSITPCFQISSGTLAEIGWPRFAQAVSPGSSLTHPDLINPAYTRKRWVRSSRPQKSLRCAVVGHADLERGLDLLAILELVLEPDLAAGHFLALDQNRQFDVAGQDRAGGVAEPGRLGPAGDVLQPLDGTLCPLFVQSVDLSDEWPVIAGPGDHELTVAGDEAEIGRIFLGGLAR